MNDAPMLRCDPCGQPHPLVAWQVFEPRTWYDQHRTSWKAAFPGGTLPSWAVLALGCGHRLTIEARPEHARLIEDILASTGDRALLARLEAWRGHAVRQGRFDAEGRYVPGRAWAALTGSGPRP